MDHHFFFFQPEIGAAFVAIAAVAAFVAALLRGIEGRRIGGWSAALSRVFGIPNESSARWLFRATLSERLVSIAPAEGTRYASFQAEILLARPLHLTVQRRPWAERDGAELRTVPALESEAVISGAETEMIALLDAPMRQDLSRLLALGATIRRDRIVLRMRALRGPEALGEAILQCVAFANRIPSVVAPTPTIVIRARTDPDPAWRRRALEHLIVHTPGSTADVASALRLDDEPAVRALANLCLGAEVRLADARSIANLTADVARSLLPMVLRNDAESGRIALLGTRGAREAESVSTALAMSLGSSGSVRAIPVLSSLIDDPLSGDSAVATAMFAIQQIRARSSNAGEGQLTVAELSGGTLALADSHGVVSLPKKQEA